MAESAPPVEAHKASPLSDNVIAFRGAFRAPPVTRADPDALIAAAAKIEGLHDHAVALRIALGAEPLPSGTLERLEAIAAQIEVVAKLVEHDAIVLQGAGDVA